MSIELHGDDLVLSLSGQPRLKLRTTTSREARRASEQLATIIADASSAPLVPDTPARLDVRSPVEMVGRLGTGAVGAYLAYSWSAVVFLVLILLLLPPLSDLVGFLIRPPIGQA
jgi:hypothetical protein